MGLATCVSAAWMGMSLVSWKGDRPFAEAVREVFAKHPAKESLLLMEYPGGGSGLEGSDTEEAGSAVEYGGAASVFGTTGALVVMRVERTRRAENGTETEQ